VKFLKWRIILELREL